MRTVVLLIFILFSFPIYSITPNEAKDIKIKSEIELTQTSSLSFPLETYIKKAAFIQLYIA